MGALHDGHLALIDRARAEHDVVVVSVFVNPTQFNDAADLAAYPRGEERDARARVRRRRRRALRSPRRPRSTRTGFATTVTVGGPLTAHARGRSTAGSGHFDGVTTVVAKLLTIVAPDAAYFGQKDAQQLAVVRRMAARPRSARPDRRLPDRARRGRSGAVEPQHAPVGRRARARAVALTRAAAGRRGDRRRRAARRRARSRGRPRSRCGPAAPTPSTSPPSTRLTLAPVRDVAGDVLLLTAARVGDVRLIDNLTVGAPVPSTQPVPPPSMPGRRPRCGGDPRDLGESDVLDALEHARPAPTPRACR